MCEIFEKLKKKFFLGKQCFLSILRQNRVKKKYFFSVTIFEKILRNYFENFFENFFETFFSAQNNTITPKKMSLRNISSNTLLTFIFLNLDTNVLRSAFSVRVTSYFRKIFWAERAKRSFYLGGGLQISIRLSVRPTQSF